jgi:hypothetical protein
LIVSASTPYAQVAVSRLSIARIRDGELRPEGKRALKGSPSPTSPLSSHKESRRSRCVTLFRVVNCYVGNLPPMPGELPDYPAPVIRNAGDNAGWL